VGVKEKACFKGEMVYVVDLKRVKVKTPVIPDLIRDPLP